MDADTFKKIFLPYHQELYKAAYRILQDRAGAEDALQECYIKLWNGRKDSIENPKAFAFIVLRNICLDMLRKVKEEYLSEIDENVSDSEYIARQFEMEDDLFYVRKIIDKLPGQQQLIMKLKHLDEYSDQEIENEIGLSAGNIRVILSRARKTVKEQFLKRIRNENK